MINLTSAELISSFSLGVYVHSLELWRLRDAKERDGVTGRQRSNLSTQCAQLLLFYNTTHVGIFPILKIRICFRYEFQRGQTGRQVAEMEF